LLLCAVLGLAAWRLWEAGRVEVLAAARAVAAGQTIETEDLRVVEVAVDAGVATVSAADRDDVVGHTAATPLLAGQLLAPDAIGTAPVIDSGHATVGVVLEAGRYPPGLEVGGRFLAVPLPADAATSVTGDAVEVEVLALREPSTGQSAWSASLLVPRSEAERLTVLAAQNRLGLVGLGGAE
jgi:hypothetical protein